MRGCLRLTLAVVLTALAACNQSSTKSAIGVVAPLTGEGATYGASMKRGFDLAMKGSEIQLIYEDSKLDARAGVAAAQKLISLNKVPIIYGDAASGVTAAIVPVTTENKVVLFSSISTADSLSNASPYFYRNVPPNSVQGRTAAEFLAKKTPDGKVAIFNENDEYGTNLAATFKESAKRLGLSIVYENTYLNTDTDYRTPLLNIKNSGAAAVFIPGNYGQSQIILKQAAELGVKAIWIGGDGSYSPSLIQYAGAAAEGFYCVIMAVDKGTDMYKTFAEKFKAEYSRDPDVYDTYAYEAGLILRETAAKGSGKYKEYLDSTTFNSFSGLLTFKNGEVDRLYGVEVVRNGQFVAP